MPLRPKHERFVAEYLKDCNATQAAIRAGYSAKTAKVQGSDLLTKPDIKAAVKAGQQAALDDAGLTIRDVAEAIGRQVKADIRCLFDDRGNLRPIKDLTQAEASLIAGFEVIIKNAKAGDGVTDEIHKVKLKDQSKYVEMAAKHFGWLIEKVDHSGTLVIKHELGD